MTTQLVRSTLRWMVEGGVDVADFHWFDITGLPDQVDLQQPWLPNYRPPFENCMVVWQGVSETKQVYEALMMVKGTDPEEGVLVTVYKGAPGRMPLKSTPLVYVVDGSTVRYGPVDEDETVDSEDANMTLNLVSAWYGSLAQGCDSYVPHVRPTFTNRRKIEQGKAPTYDWTTVVIRPAPPRSEYKGGTHASPRQHDRRGHLRRLRSGKNVWVRAHKVGDASRGAVFHDYQIAQAA